MVYPSCGARHRAVIRYFPRRCDPGLLPAGASLLPKPFSRPHDCAADNLRCSLYWRKMIRQKVDPTPTFCLFFCHQPTGTVGISKQGRQSPCNALIGPFPPYRRATPLKQAVSGQMRPYQSGRKRQPLRIFLYNLSYILLAVYSPLRQTRSVKETKKRQQTSNNKGFIVAACNARRSVTAPRKLHALSNGNEKLMPDATFCTGYWLPIRNKVMTELAATGMNVSAPAVAPHKMPHRQALPACHSARPVTPKCRSHS